MELFKEKIAARCAEKGITEYELYYQLGQSTCVGIFQQEVNQFTSSMDGGLCFRCVVDGKLGYASTEELNPEGAAELVDKAADNAKVLECEDPVILGQGGQEYVSLERKLYDLPDTACLIRTALDAQKAAQAAVVRETDNIVEATLAMMEEAMTIVKPDGGRDSGEKSKGRLSDRVQWLKNSDFASRSGKEAR